MNKSYSIQKKEYKLLSELLYNIKEQSNSEYVFITNLEGHCVATAGELNEGFISTMSSLLAASIAAFKNIADLLQVKSFHNLLCEAGDRSIHASIIHEEMMLVLIFARDSNLGLIRFTVNNALDKLTNVLQTIREQNENRPHQVSEIMESLTSEDIDEIFRES